MHRPHVPLPGSYWVVRELVMFSLCGQASLSHYWTHADAAAPEKPAAAPSQPFSLSHPTMDRNKRPLQLKESQTVLQKKNVLLLLMQPLNIRLKVQISRNCSPIHPPSPPTPLINFQGISHRRLAHRGPLRWGMAAKSWLCLEEIFIQLWFYQAARRRREIKFSPNFGRIRGCKWQFYSCDNKVISCCENTSPREPISKLIYYFWKKSKNVFDAHHLVS